MSAGKFSAKLAVKTTLNMPIYFEQKILCEKIGHSRSLLLKTSKQVWAVCFEYCHNCIGQRALLLQHLNFNNISKSQQISCKKKANLGLTSTQHSNYFSRIVPSPLALLNT